jgi:hypothetical protein
MSKIYTDYFNKTAITLPDKFIDVKTGESHTVSPKVQEQIEYHTKNSTLIHLVLSALNQYLNPRMVPGGTEEILVELSEIKKMLQEGIVKNESQGLIYPINQPEQSIDLDMDIKNLQKVLDAFGG